MEEWVCNWQIKTPIYRPTGQAVGFMDFLVKF